MKRRTAPTHHIVTCPECKTDRTITHANWLTQRSKGSTFICRSCSMARAWAKSRIRQAEPGSAPGRVVMQCPGCGVRREVSSTLLYRGTGLCHPCGLASRRPPPDRRPPHPMPGPSRRLSFDLDEVVKQFRGQVKRCPTADLRETQPIPVKQEFAYDDYGLPVVPVWPREFP